jgi:hypothetical protein
MAPRSHVGNYPNLGLDFQPEYHRRMARTKFSKADAAFRDLLKGLRTTRRLSQTALAARLDQPQSYVSKYETGERRLDFVETLLVCEALGVDFVDFAKDFAKDLARLSERKRSSPS